MRFVPRKYKYTLCTTKSRSFYAKEHRTQGERQGCKVECFVTYTHKEFSKLPLSVFNHPQFGTSNYCKHKTAAHCRRL